MKSNRILGVSSDRADLGIVLPVWRALAAKPSIDLHVFLTGAHAIAPQNVLSRTPDGVTSHIGGGCIAGSRDHDAQVAMSMIGNDAAGLMDSLKPDLLLVAGDRLDMFPVVAASIPFNIPIAHIAGGDLSFGAIDERLRHATTKLSHIHFVLNEQAAIRVHGMGEESWRIHISGAPNLDTLLEVEEISAALLALELGIQTVTGLRVVTVHPETNSRDCAKPLTAVLEALDRDPAPTVVTAPNSDPGADTMTAQIKAYIKRRPWAVYRENLGARLYANVMRRATVMVGNSSSGIIEAGLFGLPVINVGTRQAGRDVGRNVVHCASDSDEIQRCLRNLPLRIQDSGEASLYGDGRSGGRIADIIGDLPDRARLLYKTFETTPVTFCAPWRKLHIDTFAMCGAS